uniref:Uncharacterized protein n=1 Tax=Oryza sativa subsp. japonica TaxID=39947 RepID=Q5Z813_ORYSJ|nr:hypothetical protein [Oryza sativa Japonica Group]
MVIKKALVVIQNKIASGIFCERAPPNSTSSFGEAETVWPSSSSRRGGAGAVPNRPVGVREDGSSFTCKWSCRTSWTERDTVAHSATESNTTAFNLHLLQPRGRKRRVGHSEPTISSSRHCC